MKSLITPLIFALCLFCFSAEPRSRSAGRRGGSDLEADESFPSLLSFGHAALADKMMCVFLKGEKAISISYLLDGNGFQSQDASHESEVGKWLQQVQQKAEKLLKQETSAEIKFNLINISLTDEELTKNLLSWTSMGSCGSESLMNAGTVLEEIKSESAYSPLRTHIICVLTRLKLYQGDLINLLGYAMHNTLCISTVPMLLTYNPENINNTGHILSQLVMNSTVYNFRDKKRYFDKCNNGGMFDNKYPKRLSRTKSL
uniref:Putative ixodes 26 kDa salivary protein n=1 Tax=Ixodes ricinus TaxID=34613 RepID=A0A0K8R7H7_IXORI